MGRQVWSILDKIASPTAFYVYPDLQLGSQLTDPPKLDYVRAYWSSSTHDFVPFLIGVKNKYDPDDVFPFRAEHSSVACGVTSVAIPSARSRPLAQDHVCCRATAGDVLHALVAERAQVDAVNSSSPRPRRTGRDDEVQLVDQAGLQVLADGRHAAAEADVRCRRGFTRLLQAPIRCRR